MSENNKPIDPNRPDLDEGIDVVAVHSEVLSANATTAREKRVKENGMEPISLWFILGAAAIAMFAGAIFGQGPGFFSMGSFVSDSYVTAPPPTGGKVEVPPMAAKAALMQRGATVYNKCIGCHGGNGQGDGANYPPLAGADWVTGDTQALAMIILHGLQGEIQVNGQTWNGNMPAQASGLGAGDLAAVMTYVRNSWGNAAPVVSPAQAQSALDLTRSAQGQVTQAELLEKHMRDLDGEPIDPETLVDFSTLEPVE